MENKVTTADLEAALEAVYQPTVEPIKQSRSWTWMILGVVGFLSLCGVASFCFAWHVTNKHPGALSLKLQGTVDADSSSQQKMLTQIAKSTKAAIHLHVSDVDHEENSLHWVSGVDQSFTKGGLKLENNHIIIPHDGLYFVYSQASFGILCKSSEDEGGSSNTHLSYSVQWSSLTSPSKYKRLLLSGFKTVCQSKMEEQKNRRRVYESIYLGAVFQLYKGDKLSAVSNHFSDIIGQSSKTFFGVFEL